MPFGETKVYSDGSHFIAIPHSVSSQKRRPKPPEEVITVTVDQTQEQDSKPVETDTEPMLQEVTESNENVNVDTPKIEYQMTKKELFNKLYIDNINLPKTARRAAIINAMQSYFENLEETQAFVDINFERKQRNLICRRIRCSRKANLQNFNYFVTFTYNSDLHTEASYKKKLNFCLQHLSSRKKWKYIGVYERSPEKKRLHFHGIFDIPDGTMPGIIYPVEDYNLKTHRRQITMQNTYFNDNFGRSDFVEIKSKKDLSNQITYLLKYIEKSGDKIIYSKGLPQYFISDISDDDVVCRIGIEDKKLLLFDDFHCYDEGVLIGRVSKETISQLRTAN